MMVKKFDVVIGNPPYQLKEANSKNTKLLYTEFVYKAKELSDRVLFVIPSNYLTGNKGPLKTFREFIKKNGLVEISEDKSEYFASVDTAGISILNLDDSSKDTFIFDNVEVANDLTNSKIVTNFKAAKLYEDLCSSSNKLNCSRGKRGIYKASVEEYSKEPTDKLNVPMFLNSRGGEPVVVYVEPNSKMDVSADHFALVTQDWNKTDLTFNNVWYRKVKHFTSNLNFIYFILKEDETYENFLTYVNSNLFKFLLKHSDTGSRALPIGSLKQFPTVDFNRSWTDETLYAEFGLSPENITVIESFV